VPAPQTRSFQWHPIVHERWAEERLHFWFLKYQSIYDRHMYVLRLEVMFHELGIRSYTVYELTGGFDLLARIWVPNTVRTEELEKRLYELDQMDEAVRFKVQETFRQWPWRYRQNGSYEIRRPEPLDVDAGPLSRDIATLNVVNSQAVVSERPQDLEPRVTASRKEQSELLKQYETANLLVRPRYRNRGIKFVVLVTSQRGKPEELSIITTKISQTMDEACRRGTLNEASLHFGQDFEKGRYLILARVPYMRYHEVIDRLLTPINRLVGIVATRTITYMISTPGFVAHCEQLPVKEPDTPVIPEDAVELLSKEESQTFEVKGSGLTNLDRWIKGSGEHTDSDQAVSSVARAIVSLLNASGGIVLLGALEESKYPEESDKNERLGDYKDLRLGNYLCIGVDREMKRKGGWDDYVRHLRSKVLKRIGGGSGFWVGEFEKRVVTTPDGRSRTLVGIPVRRPDEWFWMDGDAFIVRRGPESERLKGKEMSDYMRVAGARGGWRPS